MDDVSKLKAEIIKWRENLYSIHMFIGRRGSIETGNYKRADLANLNTFINNYPDNCVVEIIGNIHKEQK